MTFAILRSSLVAFALSVPLAAPAAITYEYRGVTEHFGTTPAFAGKAVVATFIVDDSLGGVPVGGDPNNTMYPFSVLSATFQIDGLSFSSRAIGDFDVAGNHLAADNTNYARVRSEPAGPGTMRNTLQLETEAPHPHSYIFLTVDFQVDVFGASPFGPDLPFCPASRPACLFDNASGPRQTVLQFRDFTSSGLIELTSGNGIVTALHTVTPVPEPETWAVLLAGLGVLGFAARRRKPKDVAA